MIGKLYLALMRSLQKKGTKLAIQQRNQNYRAIVQQENNGIITAAPTGSPGQGCHTG